MFKLLYAIAGTCYLALPTKEMRWARTSADMPKRSSRCTLTWKGCKLTGSTIFLLMPSNWIPPSLALPPSITTRWFMLLSATVSTAHKGQQLSFLENPCEKLVHLLGSHSTIYHILSLLSIRDKLLSKQFIWVNDQKIT